jgi:hypothetical protein
MLRFISQRHNIAQTEIISAARAGIAATVSEEFNKIGFPLRNLSADRTYNAVLTRSPQTGHYILSYERPEIQNDNKELSAPSLEALLAEMRNNRDFVQSDIATVREKVELIPAVVYAEWKTKGVARGADALALVTETLTSFYLNPSRDTYNAVRGIYARYHQLAARAHDPFASAAGNSLRGAISALSVEINGKISSDILSGNTAVLARVPDDVRYNIFSTPYSTSTGN